MGGGFGCVFPHRREALGKSPELPDEEKGMVQAVRV